MGKAIRASVLALLLAGSAQAGYMQNDVTGTPPPPPSAMQEEPTVKGYMPNGAADSLTETVLSVVEGVLVLALL